MATLNDLNSVSTDNIGDIKLSYGQDIESDSWLKCDGSFYYSSKYQELYNNLCEKRELTDTPSVIEIVQFSTSNSVYDETKVTVIDNFMFIYRRNECIVYDIDTGKSYLYTVRNDPNIYIKRVRKIDNKYYMIVHGSFSRSTTVYMPSTTDPSISSSWSIIQFTVSQSDFSGSLTGTVSDFIKFNGRWYFSVGLKRNINSGIGELFIGTTTTLGNSVSVKRFANGDGQDLILKIVNNKLYGFYASADSDSDNGRYFHCSEITIDSSGNVIAVGEGGYFISFNGTSYRAHQLTNGFDGMIVNNGIVSCLIRCDTNKYSFVDKDLKLNTDGVNYVLSEDPDNAYVYGGVTELGGFSFLAVSINGKLYINGPSGTPTFVGITNIQHTVGINSTVLSMFIHISSTSVVSYGILTLDETTNNFVINILHPKYLPATANNSFPAYIKAK